MSMRKKIKKKTPDISDSPVTMKSSILYTITLYIERDT